MNKKGDITWETIVFAIIALIVLLILIFIFKDQLRSAASSFMNILKGTEAGSEDIGKSITNIFKGD